MSKYVREFEEKREELMKGGEDIQVQALIESLVESNYKSEPRVKPKCTPEVEELLKQYLLENEKNKKC